MKNLIECIDIELQNYNPGGLSAMIKNKLNPIIKKYNGDGYKVVSTELVKTFVGSNGSLTQASLVIIFEKI